MIYRDFYCYLLEQFAHPVALFTGARKQPFTLYSDQDKLFVKNSKNKVRRIQRESVDAFIARFEETGSFTPADYHDVTFNSSYLLAAMNHLSNMEVYSTNIMRFHNQESADSERQYHLWLKNHPDGFVLSLLKNSEGKGSISASNSTCLHASGCSSINNDRHYSQPKPFTGGDYFKVCAENLQELEAEALKITQLQQIKRCRCLKNIHQ